MGLFSSWWQGSTASSSASALSSVTSSSSSRVMIAVSSSIHRYNKKEGEGVEEEKGNRKQNEASMEALEARLRGALWGFFSGDALAAPTHWYYGGMRQIQGDYGRLGITDYTKPVVTLRGSIMNKSNVNGGGRGSFPSKRSQKQQKTVIGDIINHGKLQYWDPQHSYHYHATLQRGENTLEVQLARVLMKSIVDNDGEFHLKDFVQKYIQFMMTPGTHNDTYASTCHRMFFANYVVNQLPVEQCPDNDGHNVDTIDGLVLPTIVAMARTAKEASIRAKQQQQQQQQQQQLSSEEEQRILAAIQQDAADCASATRNSQQLRTYSQLWSQLVYASLMATDDSSVSLSSSSSAFVERLNDVAKQMGMRHEPNPRGPREPISACYLSQSIPPLLDMIAKYTSQSLSTKTSSSSSSSSLDVWDALLENANTGGENVHRGSILGAIVGARQPLLAAGGQPTTKTTISSSTTTPMSILLPEKLVQGLYEKDALAKEIDAFVHAIMKQ